MSESAIYPQVVLEHYRHPRQRGRLAAYTHAADGANPLCGDRLRIELACAGGRIAHYRFDGEACAVATAAGSMLGELVAGLDRAGVAALAVKFRQLVESGASHPALGDLNAMAPLQRHAARRQCAMLPFAALLAALDGLPHATTETSSR
jgi:nitrogen fixation protein NifU and related proteins